MHCPSCQAYLHANLATLASCPSCGLTTASLTSALSHLEIPPGDYALLDPEGVLPADETAELRTSLAHTAARFPQARWRLMIGGSPKGWPSRMVSFALANLEPTSLWVIACHLDPVSRQATIALGASWEPFLTEDDLRRSLLAAQSSWHESHYAVGWLAWLTQFEKCLTTRAAEISETYTLT